MKRYTLSIWYILILLAVSDPVSGLVSADDSVPSTSDSVKKTDTPAAELPSKRDSDIRTPVQESASMKPELAIAVSSIQRIAPPPDKPLELPSDASFGKHGEIYILDGVNSRVVTYDAKGKYVKSFGKPGSGAGEFNLPLGICVGPTGDVFVADTGNRRIQRFHADGTHPTTISAPELQPKVDLTDIVISPKGDTYYLADNDNHRILVGTFGNNTLDTWGRPGRSERQFRYPFLLDITRDGYLLIVEAINTRVQVMNPRGKFVSFIGDWGVKPGQLFRPKGVANMGEKVFVTDSYLGRIQAFDLRGRFLGVLVGADGTPLDLKSPLGIAADTTRHRLLVVEMDADRATLINLEP